MQAFKRGIEPGMWARHGVEARSRSVACRPSFDAGRSSLETFEAAKP